MWFVGLLAYRFDQPPEVVGGIFIVGIIAAVMEWLTIKSKEEKSMRACVLVFVGGAKRRMD